MASYNGIEGYWWKKQAGFRCWFLVCQDRVSVIGHMWKLTSGKYEACPYGGAPIKEFSLPYEAQQYMMERGVAEPLKYLDVDTEEFVLAADA